MGFLAQVAGWDVSTITTAALSGVAALTGTAAILMNRHLQRDQQQWQEAAETRRRDWEASQERERRDWQETQVLQTRWDDYKRALYSNFLAQADRLYDVTGELGDVRSNLAEDLANHMLMVEDHYSETESARLESMTDEERQEFWKDIYEGQVAWFKERRSELGAVESEIKSELAQLVGEIDLMAPELIRGVVKELASLSQQTMYGFRIERREQREEARRAYVDAVRDDLRVAK